MRLSDEIIPVIHTSRTSPARIWWDRIWPALAVFALAAAIVWLIFNVEPDPEGLGYMNSESIRVGGEE